MIWLVSSFYAAVVIGGHFYLTQGDSVGGCLCLEPHMSVPLGNPCDRAWCRRAKCCEGFPFIFCCMAHLHFLQFTIWWTVLTSLGHLHFCFKWGVGGICFVHWIFYLFIYLFIYFTKHSPFEGALCSFGEEIQTQNFNFYNIIQNWINKAAFQIKIRSSVGTLFEVREVAGSDKYEQHQKKCCPLRSVCLFREFVNSVHLGRNNKSMRIFVFRWNSLQQNYKVHL